MAQPYLAPLSDTSVRMTDPNDPQNKPSRFRPSTLPPSSTYTFSHVFPPNTSQSDFFTKTTLPLVRDVLQGQNGLLFTYGVTNSGKTYTVQGGTTEGSAGILPRTLDVLFNSIDGLHGDGRVSKNYNVFVQLWLTPLSSFALSGCKVSNLLTLTIQIRHRSHPNQPLLKSLANIWM